MQLLVAVAALLRDFGWVLVVEDSSVQVEGYV
jgi:hypothetical protein